MYFIVDDSISQVLDSDGGVHFSFLLVLELDCFGYFAKLC